MGRTNSNTRTVSSLCTKLRPWETLTPHTGHVVRAFARAYCSTCMRHKTPRRDLCTSDTGRRKGNTQISLPLDPAIQRKTYTKWVKKTLACDNKQQISLGQNFNDTRKENPPWLLLTPLWLPFDPFHSGGFARNSHLSPNVLPLGRKWICSVRTDTPSARPWTDTQRRCGSHPYERWRTSCRRPSLTWKEQTVRLVVF